MPGRHPPGYQAAVQRTIRQAARLWRAEHHPDEWRAMLDRNLQRRKETEK